MVPTNAFNNVVLLFIIIIGSVPLNARNSSSSLSVPPQ
jgi:hypothetical protein